MIAAIRERGCQDRQEVKIEQNVTPVVTKSSAIIEKEEESIQVKSNKSLKRKAEPHAVTQPGVDSIRWIRVLIPPQLPRAPHKPTPNPSGGAAKRPPPTYPPIRFLSGSEGSGCDVRHASAISVATSCRPR
jgi:hypothetical protein